MSIEKDARNKDAVLLMDEMGIEQIAELDIQVIIFTHISPYYIISLNHC